MPPTEPAATQPQQSRRARIRSFRREMVVEAAANLFAERGLEATSMRAIAGRIGCTTGALYADFDGKEEIYAEVLSASLTELEAAVSGAMRADGCPLAAVRAGIMAFFDYYAARPENLALGLYLHQGLKPRGLRPDLDRALNDQLAGIHSALAQSTARAGLSKGDVMVTSLLAQSVGLLVLEQSGRLRLFGGAAREQMTYLLDQVLPGPEIPSGDALRSPVR